MTEATEQQEQDEAALDDGLSDEALDRPAMAAATFSSAH
jgi:hypothetical protein